MKAFYCDQFVLPLPAGHRFPMAKYGRLRARVERELAGVSLIEPEAAAIADLLLAHDADYVAAVVDGTLSPAEQRVIGFPWSQPMVERARRSVGATLSACRAALVDGVAANLAGGTHHSERARGAGYCVFNDIAVAARRLQADAGRAVRVAIIDLDVHQGDGTARILAGDDSVFTLSIHADRNFPTAKASSDLDIGLDDETGDADYLAALDSALDQLTQRFDPEFVIYVAGADAHHDDRLGRLALTSDGMSRRDRRVLEFARELNTPIAVTMAGGYGRDLETTVDVHFHTVRCAFESCVARSGSRIECTQ